MGSPVAGGRYKRDIRDMLVVHNYGYAGQIWVDFWIVFHMYRQVLTFIDVLGSFLSLSPQIASATFPMLMAMATFLMLMATILMMMTSGTARLLNDILPPSQNV